MCRRRHSGGHDAVWIREPRRKWSVSQLNDTGFSEVKMRLSWAATAAALALLGITSGAIAAGQTDPLDESNVAIGIGIICNTPEQMQRLVGMRIDGAEMDRAVSVVNNEAHDPRACGVAAVAFMTEKLVDMKNVQGKMVQIVRINVVAAYDGQQWARVPVMTQYALLEPEGYSI
jgi:hypothetical protein